MQVQTTTPLDRVLGGRYRLAHLLGQGGTGSVYLATDTQLFDRPVAVKELIEQFGSDAERTEAVARFAREAEMLVRLSHPNLPDVRSYFAEDGRHYLVMEYIEGHTLLELLDRAGGVLPPLTVLDWGRQICDVLAYLHSRTPPVVFRDLKPANIMLDRHGRIKLIDFGTARHFDTAKHTDTLKMGSIGYAPPEQYQGQGQTSPQTDIYALGATLHQVLTNQDPSARPFVFTPPSLLRPEISELASRAVMRALNLDPAQRFSSAAEMRRALEHGIADAPTSLLSTPPPATAPNRLLMGALAIAGAALVETAALGPELPHLGQGTASANWAVDYSMLLAPAIGGALASSLATSGLRHPVRAALGAFAGAVLPSAAAGLVIIFGLGHGEPHLISLRALAATTFVAAILGALLMRGLGFGE